MSPNSAICLLLTLCGSASAFLNAPVPSIQLPVSVGAPSRVPAPLSVVADAEETERNSRRDSSDAWIPTKDGGFLPNLRPHKPLQVESIQDYKAHVADEKERLVCVRFYAPWCRACRAIEAPFRQLARQYPEIKLVEVPLTKENGYLHAGLGVPSLPFGHLYHPEAGLVEERSLNKKVFGEFRDTILKSYVEGSCPLEEKDTQ